ncbi:hypothetical protein LJB77_02855 [Ruminococcaceae bacterium OttesenSCG-928-N02]|nr:hypothetical protein [Ruminococcaceae bacterium OttesenSCG-928-N02]
MKKKAALLLAVIMAVASFTACGKNHENVLIIDGVDIPAGIYLIAQAEAYGLAQQEVGTGVDVFDADFGDVTPTQWIYNKTVLLCQRYIYVNRLFAQRGLVITEDEMRELESTINSNWESYGAYYERNGVGRDSYAMYYTNNYKVQQLLETMYIDVNGEYAVTNEEAMAYMDENYVRVEYIVLPLINSTTYQPLTEETQQAVHAIATDMADALNGLGEDESAVNIVMQYLPLAYSIAGTDDLDVSTPENFITSNFISKTNENYTQELIEELFAAEIGAYTVYKPTDNYYWVARRIVNFKSEEEFNYYRESVVYTMANEEFYDTIEAAAAEYEVSEVRGAVKYYSAKNIVE